MAHQVALEQPWRGVAKLARMAAMAIDEVPGGGAARGVGRRSRCCCAWPNASARAAGWAGRPLFMRAGAVCSASRFVAESAIVAAGTRRRRAGACPGAQADSASGSLERVLIAAADSLLTWPTLSHYERSERLLTEGNSNGFMPGEGAGALLVARSERQAASCCCTGIGFGMRAGAHRFRRAACAADGLLTAITGCAGRCGCDCTTSTIRITDLSGEQYYFKEAALALCRILRERKEEFDIWHPAECIGEAGAAGGAPSCAGGACGVPQGLCARPERSWLHMANDAGQRAAVVAAISGAR